MVNGKHFQLTEGVYLIKGSARAAIYNTNQGDVYSIDGRAGRSLDFLLEGKTFEDTIAELQMQPNVLSTWLDQLAENNLGYYSEVQPSGQQLPPKPPQNLDFVWLELTKGCNLRCLHCYDDSSPEVIASERKSSGVMTHDDWLSVISQASDLGVRRMQFIGGEPLLYSRIFELAEHARERNVDMLEIFTNGNLINEERANKIAQYGLNIAMSLYGPNAEIHDRITQGEGSFEKTLRAINLLKERNVPMRIGVIAMRYNEDYLHETLRFVKEGLGIEDCDYDLVRPVGRGCSGELVSEKLYQRSIVTKARFPKVSKSVFINRLYGHPCFPGKLYISSDSNVFLCGMEQDKSLGNLSEQSLKEIIEDENTVKLWGLSKDNIETCCECEYRYACYDCRPKSKVEGNFLAKPKECMYDPRTGSWEQSV